MTRKSVHIDSSQHERLRERSFVSNTPITELVRMGVDLLLSKKQAPIANAPLGCKSKKERSNRWGSQVKQELIKGAKK